MVASVDNFVDGFITVAHHVTIFTRDGLIAYVIKQEAVPNLTDDKLLNCDVAIFSSEGEGVKAEHGHVRYFASLL